MFRSGKNTSGALSVSPNVHASAHEDGLALLNISTGKVFLANGIGARIWHDLIRGLEPDAISYQISREYGVSEESVRRHTGYFLSELLRYGLVTRK